MGTWQFYKGRRLAKPLMEYVVMALLSGGVGWQAVLWLQTSHPEASQLRHVGVWLQLVSGFGLATLMLLNGWIARFRVRSNVMNRRGT